MACGFGGIVTGTTGKSRVPEDIGFFDIEFSDLVELPASMAGRGWMWVSPEEQKVVGAVLAQARRASGLRQEDIAARLGKPQSFVSAYEAGQRRVDALELIRICRAMGADSVQIFTEIVEQYSA